MTTNPPAPSTADRLADAIMRLAEEDRGLVRSKLVEVIEATSERR